MLPEVDVPVIVEFPEDGIKGIDAPDDFPVSFKQFFRTQQYRLEYDMFCVESAPVLVGDPAFFFHTFKELGTREWGENIYERH